MSDASPSDRRAAKKALPRNAGSIVLAPRPALAAYAAYAMAGAAVFGAVASVDLLFQDTYVYDQALKTLNTTNGKAKPADKQSAAQLMTKAHEQVSATHKSAVIGAVIVLLALGFIGYGIWRGRHWARWGTLAIWVLSTFTATSVGIGSVLAINADIPGAYKFPAFVAGVLLVAAVILTNLRPVVAWFALSKPAPAAGGRQKGGLFGSRPARTAPGTAAQAPGSGRTSLIKASPASRSHDRAADASAAAAIIADRGRSKKRAGAASVTKGADLARTRAKAASKSRRTES